MSDREEKKPGHFEAIWSDVILDAVNAVWHSCNEDFKQFCGLESLPSELWKKRLDKAYHRRLRELKETCYGEGANNGLMDHRKLAAVVCAAIMEEKPYTFDLLKAAEFQKDKSKILSPVKRNRWAVDHSLINYKLAYFAGLQMIYLMLLEDLFSTAKTKDCKKAEACAMLLHQYGHLIPYRRAKEEKDDADSFDVNMIFGLARCDTSNGILDMFLLAMQFYQIEMYTRERLAYMTEYSRKENGEL